MVVVKRLWRGVRVALALRMRDSAGRTLLHDRKGTPHLAQLAVVWLLWTVGLGRRARQSTPMIVGASCLLSLPCA